MELVAGEYTCPECKGVVSANTIICTRCCGAGKIDWVDNAMGEQDRHTLHHSSMQAFALQPNNDVTFYSNNQEMLKIAEDGFYVQGRKLKDDKDVYERFNKFLKGVGC